MTDILAPDLAKPGPHGGKWLKSARGFVEVSVFETDVPPRFRLYFSHMDGRLVAAPRPADLKLTTIRDDGARQTFAFVAKEDFLEATDHLPEPHEFDFSLQIKDGQETLSGRFTEEHDHGHAGHAHAHTRHDDHGHEGHAHDEGLFGWLTGSVPHSHSIAEKTDTALESNELGIRTLKLTLVILAITAAFQLAIVLMSGSVALMADMIHNFADATTSLPLWLAFALARKGASRRFTYGYGKVEDIAGVVIVLIIFGSACIAAYESVMKIIHPEPMTDLVWVAAAAIVGFVGNEWVAFYRIRVGKRIGSAALVADGYHARVDGFTSLAVLIGVVGVLLGFPILDPIVGVGITLAILFIVKDATVQVWTRLIDGIEPAILRQIEHAPLHVAGVEKVHDVRARWMGHRVHADVVIDVAPELTVRQAAALTKVVEKSLVDHVPLLGSAIVRAQPRG